MRIFTHSRGVPPKLRSSTVRAFMPDKDFTAAGDLEDIIDASYSLSPNVATVDLSDCPVSGARLYPGDRYIRDGSGASGDHAIFTDECTWQMWLYIDSDQVKSSAYAFSYGQQGETSATNILMSVKAQEVSGTLRLRSFWEYASGTNQEATSSLSPPVDEWCHIAMVREDDPNNAGKCRMRFYVNGCQMRDANGDPEFLDNSGAGFEYPAGGTSSRWAIGGLYGSTSFYFTGRIGPVMVYSEALTDADIQEDYRRGLGWATGNRVHIRVLAEDNFGNMQNLSAVPAPNGETVDMLQGVRIDDSVDKRVTTGTVNLFRGHGRINLSPLMSESFLNRATSASTLANRTDSTLTQTSYTAPTDVDPTTFLNIGRFIRIQMSRMPYGLKPDEVPTFSVFTGGSTGGTATDWVDLIVGYVDVVDFGKDVISLNIRDQGALLSDTFIEEDDPVAESEAGPGSNPKRYIADSTNLGAAIQDIVTNNWTSPFGVAAPTLFEPIASLWQLSEGIISRDLVMGAINKLAGQIAWMVRYKWDKSQNFSNGQTFRLTLHEPDREKVIADGFISTDDYVDISKLSLDISGVRNVIKIAYYGPTFVDSIPRTVASTIRTPAANYNIQNYYEATDTGSVSKYGRRYMELQESPVDLIDSGNEANRMASGILADLKEPLAHTSLNGKDLVEVELNDMLSIEANNQSFDSDQNYAVSTLNMDIKNGFVDVSFGLRGTPSSGSKRHISMERTSATGPQAPFNINDGTRPTLTAVQNFMRPLASLAAFGGQEPSLANQFFEQWRGGVNDSLSEPIGWTTSGGTWGSGGDVYVKTIGSGAVAGQTGSFLMDITSASGELQSDFFAVRAGNPYVIKVRAAVTDTGVQLGGEVKFYDNKKDATVVDTQGLATATFSAADVVEEKQFYLTAPSGAAYAKIEMYADAFVASNHLYLDMVRFTECEPFTRARPTADYTIPKTWIPYTAVNLGTEVYDIGNNFTTGASHVYTAPADGIYLVSGCVSMVLTTQDQDPQFQEGSDGQNSIISMVMHNDGSSDEVVARGSPGKPVRVDEDASVDIDGDGVADPVYTFIASSTVDTKIGLSKGDTLQLGYAGRLYHADDYSNDFYVESSATFFDITLSNGEKR